MGGARWEGRSKNFTYLAGKCSEHGLIYSRYNLVLINLHFYTYCAKSSRAIKYIASRFPVALLLRSMYIIDIYFWLPTPT